MKTQIVRNSERKDFLRCQQRWQWAWQEGLRSRQGNKIHFWFGTGVHEALAFWYGLEGIERGPDPRETWQKYCDRNRYELVSEIANDEETFQEYVQLGLDMFRGYLDTYGDDRDIQVVVPERDFAVIVRRPDGEKLRVVGTFDLVFYNRRTKRLWLGEHKTAKIIKTGHLPTDNQGGLYFSVATAVARNEGYIDKKDKLDGILYNFLRKAAPAADAVYDADGYLLKKPLKAHYAAVLLEDERTEGSEKQLLAKKLDELEAMAANFGLKVQGDRAAAQPAGFFHREEVRRTSRERKTIVTRIGQEAQWMEAVQRGTLPILKNFTNDCEWDCDFYLMCQAHEKGDDWLSFRDAIFHVTDPYKDHRKVA